MKILPLRLTELRHCSKLGQKKECRGQEQFIVLTQEINRYLAAEEAGEDTEGMLSDKLTGISEKWLFTRIVGK